MLAVAAGLGLGLGLLTLAPSRVGLAGAILLVGGAAALYARFAGWRVGLVCLLIATNFLDRYTFRAGSVDIRAEQVAAILGLVALVYLLMWRRRGWDIFRPNLAEALVLLWIVIALLSSLTAAPDVGRSIKGVALLAVSALGLALPRRLVEPAIRADVDLIVEMLLLVFAVEAAYGTLAFFAHVFGSDVSLGANVASGHLNAYGTLWEPNVFGAFCASGAVLWAWLGQRHFRFAWIGIAVCLGGLIASFTRAGWAIGLLMLAVIALAQRRQRPIMRELILGAAGAVVIGLMIIGAGRVSDYYVAVNNGTAIVQPTQHGLSALLANPIDVIGRLDQVRIAGPDITSHLLIGSGVASFGERHPIAHQGEQHLANLELAVLNDTGVLGLLAFLGFGAAVIVAAWRRRRDPTVAGLGVATLVIALTNIATETTELMITWLLVGLLLLAVDAAARSGETGS